MPPFAAQGAGVCLQWDLVSAYSGSSCLRGSDRGQARLLAQPLKDEEGDAGVGPQPDPRGQEAGPEGQHAATPHGLHNRGVPSP